MCRAVGYALFIFLLASPCLQAQRANLCERVHEITNGTRRREDGLRGVHLRVASGQWDWMDDFLRWDENTKSWTGLEVELLETLSRLAGFTYEYVMISGLVNSTNYTKHLIRAMHEHDLVACGYWMMTPRRLAAGATSPYGFLETNIYLVTAPPLVEDFTLKVVLSCLTPFSPALWATFVALTIGTGIVFRKIEGEGEEKPEKHAKRRLKRSLTDYADAIYDSMGHFTGANGFVPKTPAGKILMTSWAWCSVFLLSAFTANLASFLVVKATLKADFGSMEEALAQHRSISMSRGWPQHAWFSHAHPDYAQTIPTMESLEDMGRKIVNRTYDAALLGKFEMDKITHDPSVNPKCTLTHVGEPVLRTRGGWVVLQDMDTSCTLLVREVLEIWFLRLEMEGRLGRFMWNTLHRKHSCAAVMKSKPQDDLKPLYVQNVLGILLLHGLGVLVAFFLWLVQGARKSLFASRIVEPPESV